MTAKRNILIALMLLLLVAASACALAACNNTTAEISGVQIATDDNGDPMYGGGSYVMPEGMAFSAAASTAAETNTSVTLTANYEPAGTSNKQTNWSVSFKNPSSFWANGKTVTDYVTVESTGTNTAKVACVKAFGEQIIVKATSAVDPSVFATTTVDFEKKLEDVKFTLYLNDSAVGSAYHNDLAAGGSSPYFTMEYKENSNTVISTYPYYGVTAHIDATGDADDEYRVTIEPVFTAYTIDKTLPGVYKYVGASTMQGEQFGEIEGTDNYAVPSDLFTAPGYWATSVTDNVDPTIVPFFEDLQFFMEDQYRDNYMSLNELGISAENFYEAYDAGELTGDPGIALIATDLYFTFSDAIISGSGGMVTAAYNALSDAYSRLGITNVLDLLNSLTYDGATVDLGDYSTPEEYFANEAAKSCTRITLGFHGIGYRVSFRFNADSL